MEISGLNNDERVSVKFDIEKTECKKDRNKYQLSYLTYLYKWTVEQGFGGILSFVASGNKD